METVLVFASDRHSVEVLRQLLHGQDFLLLHADSPAQAIELVREHRPKLMIVDSADQSDAALRLCALLRRDPALPFVSILLIIPGAAEPIDRGYWRESEHDVALGRPVDRKELRAQVRNLLNLALGVRDANLSPAPLAAPRLRSFPRLIGQAPAMDRLFRLISSAAAASSPVLLIGERGVGKDLAAVSLHEAGPRAGGPYVTFDWEGSERKSLWADVLGEPGEGPDRRLGILQNALGGTLHFKNTAASSEESWDRLMTATRALASRSASAGQAGGRGVRVVFTAAGGASLVEAVEQSPLARDLMDRHQGVIIPVPPLRERVTDIQALAENFLDQFGRRYGRRVTLEARAVGPLMLYPWPGNVQELERAVENAAVLSDGGILDSISILGGVETGNAAVRPSAPARAESSDLSYPLFVARQRERELEYFRRLLSNCEGDRQLAVRLSGLSRATFYRRLNALGLSEARSRTRT